MKILVTGGAGFIGSHLVERLLAEGHSVDVIDNFDPFYGREIKERNIADALKHKNCRLFEIDIRNKMELDDYFEKNQLDLVVHLAAKAGVRPSIEDPIGYYETNVLGTLNILENMRKYRIKKLIFASSSSVYGNNKKVPFSEDDPVDYPISPYAATKKAGELMCYNYFHLYGIETFALRFFTVYGPRQRPEMAIHKFTRKIMKEETIELYGDGSTKRDYTFIDDIIDGILKSINKINNYQIINLGNSQTIDLAKLTTLIGVYADKQTFINYYPEQPGDVKQTYANIDKAIKLISYSPSTSIEEGLEKFLDWYKKYNKSN